MCSVRIVMTYALRDQMHRSTAEYANYFYKFLVVVLWFQEPVRNRSANYKTVSLCTASCGAIEADRFQLNIGDTSATLRCPTLTKLSTLDRGVMDQRNSEHRSRRDRLVVTTRSIRCKLLALLPLYCGIAAKAEC